MRKRLMSLAAAGLAAGLVLSGCATDDAGDPEVAAPSFDDCDENPLDCNSGPRAEGGEIIWLINQGWDSTWNRMTSVGNTSYLNQALRGIFADPGEFMPDGQWQWNMDLWEVEPELVNEDPMTIVYQIRDEAVWSDGTQIGIDDFRYEWYVHSGREDHCVGCTPPGTTGWDSLQSIEASDDGQTITITYEAGVADPEWFVRFGVQYPAHIAEAAGYDLSDPDSVGDSMDYFTTNVPDWSAGPYLVESAIVDERVVMVPNEAWYGEIQPTLDRITKVVISDQGGWLPALNNEEIHGGWPASWTTDFHDQVTDLPGILATTGSAGGIWEHVDVNMDSIDDLALRQAIFTAINIEHASNAIWGDIAPPFRTNHVFPQLSPYHEDYLSATGYGSGDVEAARAILADAGYAGFEEGGTLVDPDGEPVPTFRFAFLSGNENRATFTELTIAYLDQIGITVEPEPTPAEQLGTVLEDQDFDLVIFGWVGNPSFTNAPHQFYSIGSDSNYGNVQNQQIHDLSEQVRSQVDIDDSARLANELVQLLMDEAFSLPLWDNPALVFISDEYINIRPNYNAQVNPQYNNEHWGVAMVE